jgi:hypothetical protein
LELVPHLDSESETEWDNQHDSDGSDIETRKSDSGEESDGDMGNGGNEDTLGAEDGEGGEDEFDLLGYANRGFQI